VCSRWVKKGPPHPQHPHGIGHGLNGITNGRLLQLISGQFDLFLTVDTKMPHQQNLKGLPFAIFFLAIADNNFSSYTPLLPLLERNISSALPGQITHIP